ncbi:phosphatase PAP2 family protein [Staphylococcus succinus]|uniref:phosphatase PAP2 family protein n=1 Tax=Staphylococcus succinus TaxID=61015 RepID=UPI002DBEE5CE|nr:phosphatase PAP2 family protein [Staphylococcus succinus]MEB7462657.1 phosphatase PAP2 family protein [Staphylococcus succinus]
MVISKRLATLILVILSIILLVALWIDLPVSQFLMNQNSVFGTIFQDLGLFPPTLILIISMIILNFYIFSRLHSKLAKYIILIMTFIYTLIKTNSLLSETVQYVVSSLDNIKKHKPIGVASNEGDAGSALSIGAGYLITFIILLIIILVVYQFWLKRIDQNEIERLFKVALVSFFVLLIGLETIDSLKELWGRARPYEIGTHGAHFTNWLTINGNTGHSSFPSGHTADAAYFMFIAFYFKKLKSQKVIFNIGLAYTIIMCLSRLRIGAHFLGDVTMSFMLIFMLMIAADFMINKLNTYKM